MKTAVVKSSSRSRSRSVLCLRRRRADLHAYPKPSPLRNRPGHGSTCCTPKTQSTPPLHSHDASRPPISSNLPHTLNFGGQVGDGSGCFAAGLVDEQCAAARAGVRVGDRLLAVNNQARRVSRSQKSLPEARRQHIPEFSCWRSFASTATQIHRECSARVSIAQSTMLASLALRM